MGGRWWRRRKSADVHVSPLAGARGSSNIYRALSTKFTFHLLQSYHGFVVAVVSRNKADRSESRPEMVIHREPESRGWRNYGAGWKVSESLASRFRGVERDGEDEYREPRGEGHRWYSIGRNFKEIRRSR